MNKIIAVLLLTAGLGMAADPPAPAPAVPKTKAVDELTLEKVKRIQAQMQLVNEHYKIDEYNATMKPLNEEINTLLIAKCAELGASEADTNQRRCGVDIATKFPEPEFKFGKITFTPAPPLSPAPNSAPPTQPKQ